MESYQTTLQKAFIFMIFGFIFFLMVFYLVERQDLVNSTQIKIHHGNSNLLSALDKIDNV